MIKKYVYKSDKLRCRIILNKYDSYVIRIQEKRIFGIWFNIGDELLINEKEPLFMFGDGLEDLNINPMVYDFAYGGSCETYDIGTLDLKERCLKYIDEYINKKNIKENKADKFNLMDL